MGRAKSDAWTPHKSSPLWNFEAITCNGGQGPSKNGSTARYEARSGAFSLDTWSHGIFSPDTAHFPFSP